MVDTEYYLRHWLAPDYVKGTENNFHLVDQYLKTPPKRILDIGCGYANVSSLFQQKYGCELYLLDGDFADNNPEATRKAKYGPVEDFLFYSPVSKLKEQWDRQGMTYTFVDANNIHIDPDVKFDVVYSWISCGFHYPVATYKDLILRHTTEDSVIIMDFRRKLVGHEQSLAGFEVVHRLEGDDTSKKNKLHIRFPR